MKAANQPRAAATLTAALAHGPSHAYLFHGPAGSGKREMARAFAAELLTGSVSDDAADDVRRRALLDPSPHPDLIWLAPDGVQYRIEEVRERLIGVASYSPFEAGRRVFVIEAAEALREESQNALLKTLEEPAQHAHFILLTDMSEALEPTVRSRCQQVAFVPLSPEVVEAALREEDPGAADVEVRTAARLSAGDLERARLLRSEVGRELRAGAEALATAALGGAQRSNPVVNHNIGGKRPGSAQLLSDPWSGLLAVTERAASEAESVAESRLAEEAELGTKRNKTERGQIVRREARRARSEVLGLGLELTALWFRDLAATALGAPELVHNLDRRAAIEAQAQTVSPATARAAAATVIEFRRRLRLNVSEELALEALFSRLRRL